MKTIYFDNAATTRLDDEVLATMLPYMKGSYGNPSSIHALGRKNRAAIERARKSIARHLNASTAEIFFTSGGTESSNTALTGAVKNLGVKHIISSPLEHHCVLHTLNCLQKTFDTQIHFVELEEHGHINLTHLEHLLSSLQGKTLVSLMHANNEIGNLLAIEKVANLCQQYEALFHSDTVQTFGFYTIDLQATKMNFLTGAAHKFHGPKGVGFLYINGDNAIKPFMRGGAQERNMRAGTENVYGIIGMGKAADIAYENLAADSAYIKGLRNYFVNQLTELLPDVSFNGDCFGRSNYKVVNVAFPLTYKADLLLLNLDIAGVCVSGGSACSSGANKGSHVLNALPEQKEATSIRFSFSKYNTKEEIDIVMEKLLKILKIKKKEAVLV